MPERPTNPLTGDLRYSVRASSQARGASTQNKILDAAEELFADKGVEATTVAEIADRAGSSIGSLYHHFGDKETIQFALFDRFINESEAGTLAAIAPERWQGASIAGILRSYVTMIVASHRKRPSFKKAGLAVADHHPELAGHYDTVRTTLDSGLRDLLLARRTEIGHPDPETACTFVIDQMHTMLRSRHQDTPLATRFATKPDDDFIEELLRSISSYLQLTDPAEQ